MSPFPSIRLLSFAWNYYQERRLSTANRESSVLRGWLSHKTKCAAIVAAVLLQVLAITANAAIDGCSTADFKLARTFEASSNSGFPAASYAVADFNGDGKPDIAETDSGAGTVIVLLNDGTGRPVVSKAYGAGVAPRTVAAADLNGDGRPDLIVTNSQSANVSILLNVGSGLFSSATNFAVANDPIGIAFGDFNGDGKIDIAIGANSSGDGKLSILLGNGSGSFTTAPNSPILIGGQANGVAVADFNSDGKQDVVIATFSIGYFLLLGDGTGRFGAPAKISDISGASVNTADLNGDGKPDLAMGTTTGLGILLGNGLGGFSAPVFRPLPGASWIRSTAIGDVDNDGKLDVAAVGDSPGGIGYFKGDGSGGFSAMPNYLSGRSTNQLALGDFDSDGDLDIVSGESILTNIGGGVFEAARALYPQTPGSGGPSYLAFGDFNADGLTDMAVGVTPFVGPSSGRLEILLRDGSGNYARSPGIGFAGGTGLSGVAAADFNKDGKTDIALPLSVSTPFSFVVSIHLSNGDGTFAAPTTTNIGFQMGDIATGDFNNDGNADLVAVGFQGGVAVLLGNGSGGFSLSFAPNAGTFAQVAIADLNSDGKTDLIITDFSNQRVWTEMGSGTGSFTNLRSFAVGGSAANVAVGDFNLDGKLDLAVANQSSLGGFNQGSTSILLGDNTARSPPR
jgi:hypothetical protein